VQRQDPRGDERPPSERIDVVLPWLRCPVCRQPLSRQARRLGCAAGHGFDLARQGYLNLATGRAHPGTGDTTAMVEARDHVLSQGLYAPIARAVRAAVASVGLVDGLVVDLAGGTGWYLAQVLDAGPGMVGVCLDLSAPALRRAARAHPRASAVGADAWAPLPLADGSASAVLSVFGPRDPGEVERVLAPAGGLVVVSPLPQHLGQLVGPLHMLAVDPRKGERTSSTFERFDLLGRREVAFDLRLDHGQVEAVVGMGPTASHRSAADLAADVAGLPAPVEVTVAVDVRTYRRRP
jgi:23S rRNA (guanine745-N1)-methyltransferase